MKVPAIRVSSFEDLSGVGAPSGIEDVCICYWQGEAGEWLIYLPGAGVGTLTKHTVEEHEDGTITVSPSILLTGHNAGNPTTRHGFLRRGVWEEC